MSLSKVLDAIRWNKRFLISVHVDLEADAVGSELALASLLKRLGKEVMIVNQDPAPESYGFLSHLDWITLFKDVDAATLIKPDCVIIVDCPNLDRIGSVKQLIKAGTPIINIDHHVSNTMFGDVNWVDLKAAAAGEMIFDIAKKLKFELTKEEAILIYSAILIDTGSFRYSNTTAKTHLIAAELIKKKLDMNAIYECLFEMRTFRATHLMGLIISEIKRSKNGKVVWVWLTKQMLKKSGASFEEAENFIGIPRSVKECEAALFFKETDKRGIFKISLRGKKNVDVNKIAAKFGGGGHARAAGCVIKAKSRKEAERVLLKEVMKAFT